MLTKINVLLATMMTLIALIMTGGINTAFASTGEDVTTQGDTVGDTLDIEAIAFTPANEYIDTLDHLRNLGSDSSPVFRNPQVYEFSTELDALRDTQGDMISDANEFITHLDELRDLGE